MKCNSLEEVTLAYKVVCDELGRKPTRKDLVARRKSGIEAAALRYGGMYEVYKFLGIDAKQRCSRYWSEDQVRKELQEFIDKYEEFPTSDRLKETGKDGLLNKFKVEFRYELTQVPDRYYTDFANVKKEIEVCKEKIGKFPTITELEFFKPGIKFAILKYHKNYTNVRKILNEKLIRVPDGYWNNFEKTVTVKQICEITNISRASLYRRLNENLKKLV